MVNIVVADTGPLIALAKIDLLDYLADCFQTIYITDAVLSEATIDLTKPGAIAINDAINKGMLHVESVSLSVELSKLLIVLDLGEAESIMLAGSKGAIILIDEKRGRQVAKNNKLRVTGTAAILIMLKQQSKISAVKPYLGKLRNAGYRFSDSLVTEVLSRVGET